MSEAQLTPDIKPLLQLYLEDLQGFCRRCCQQPQQVLHAQPLWRPAGIAHM